MDGADDRLTLDLVSTLDDQLALLMRITDGEPFKALRRRRELIALAIAPVVMVIGFFGPWLLDPHREPLGELLHNLATIDRGFSLGLIGFMAVIVAASIIGSRLSRRPWTAMMLRRLMKTRPDADQATQTFRTRATFGPEGIVSETGIGSNTVKWAQIRSFEETDRHLFFLGAAATGFVLNKPKLTPEHLERLRAIAAAHIPAR